MPLKIIYPSENCDILSVNGMETDSLSVLLSPWASDPRPLVVTWAILSSTFHAKEFLYNAFTFSRPAIVKLNPFFNKQVSDEFLTWSCQTNRKTRNSTSSYNIVQADVLDQKVSSSTGEQHVQTGVSGTHFSATKYKDVFPIPKALSSFFDFQTSLSSFILQDVNHSPECIHSPQHPGSCTFSSSGWNDLPVEHGDLLHRSHSWTFSDNCDAPQKSLPMPLWDQINIFLRK